MKYIMYMTGVEPYIIMDSIVVGGGYGVFHGYHWFERNGRNVSGLIKNGGYTYWGMVGMKGKESELNLRLRYHRFTIIDDAELKKGEDDFDYTKDYVIVLRFIYYFAG